MREIILFGMGVISIFVVVFYFDVKKMFLLIRNED
jgi:hypothetical protein